MENGKRSIILEPKSGIEAQITQAESALGIRTKFDRLLEASLFIDKHFFDYALITGQIGGVERIFGHKEWAGYLNGRLCAKQYGKKPLTIDFILGLHTEIAQHTRPEIGGEIHPPGGRLESPTFEDHLPTYTPGQLKAIEKNPFISFDDGSKNLNRGHIKLPFIPDAQMLDHLQSICDWYNLQKNQNGYSAHRLAAVLQQKLVSLHPFWDYTGRTSRILMNWSLENSGESPSILPDFNDDLFLTEKAGGQQVAAGSDRYKKIKKRHRTVKYETSEISDEELIAIFGLQADKQFYEEIFQFAPKPPPLLPGSIHKHSPYKVFLEELRYFKTSRK